jgi:hypothetical protein
MASGFTLKFDTDKVVNALSKSATGLEDQIKQSLGDIMDSWKREAVNIALKDMGTLRQGISVEVEGGADTFTGLIKSVAVEKSGKWGAFNYAYYWHEHKKEVKNPTTPGTVAQYLDKSAEDNQAKWQAEFAADIEGFFKKLGV